MNEAPDLNTKAWVVRDFRLLFFSRMLGTIGIQMFSVAIGWHVYELTHDAFALGLIGLSQFIPSLALVLVAGEVVDQYDRKQVAGYAYALVGAAGVMLMLTTIVGHAEVWPLYVMAICLGISRVFGSPAMQALLPNIVPPQVFSNAVAVNSAGFQIAIITGPVLAGFAIAWGAPVVYGMAGACLVVAGGLSLSIDTKSIGTKRPLDWKNLIAGVKFVWERPIMIGAISLDLFSVLFGGVVALLPIFARDILQVGPEGLGFLRCAPAIGAGIMAAVLAQYPLKQHVGLWLFGSVVIFGLTIIGFGLSTSFIFSMVMLLVLGAADMISVYVRTHLMQTNTPDDMRGRVASVNMLFITASNELGEFESGLTASWFGTVPAVILGGVLAIAVAGVMAWKVPALRTLKTLH